jgi:hypothetical protein
MLQELAGVDRGVAGNATTRLGNRARANSDAKDRILGGRNA